MATLIRTLLMMSLAKRLITLRKEKGLTQQQMADVLSVHVNSLKKYEAGQAQPSLDAIKKIAVGLHVSTDFLLFEEHERGPSDDLALQLEAISQMPEGEQMVIREVLESLIIKYQSRRWDSGRQAAK
ncbi:helix-turn-helix domain-containing protein [Photobacterium leiognathi]|uniref:helix-turn-helix domain-containing protein n=1 Tax=Photobacterium leiognathi TaxID=553611 RepID=UPI0027383469|nr:helix-turn-helix transcriptional regulator [Photobacterium leiognathi]